MERIRPIAVRRPEKPNIAREVAAERLSGQRSVVEDLGPRETEILRLVASGWTADQIGTALSLSVKTVQNYHYQIKSKIGARTDAHLVWLATAAGLVTLENVG
jgi:two-component system invasion response regulator UvrY